MARRVRFRLVDLPARRQAPFNSCPYQLLSTGSAFHSSACTTKNTAVAPATNIACNAVFIYLHSDSFQRIAGDVRAIKVSRNSKVLLLN